MGETYTRYISYLNSIYNVDINTTRFKKNQNYTEILEHVSPSLGAEYLSLVQAAPYHMSDADVQNFIEYNDKCGDPVKVEYKGANGTTICCSPSSLRYILHALLIVKNLILNKATNIVEIGGGYGGLCIAIHYFARKVGLNINSYAIIDMPQVNNLISRYLNTVDPTIRYSLHDASEFGADVSGSDLFLISNYCFTEIYEELRRSYVQTLFPKVKNGFIIWQTHLVNLEYPIPFTKKIEEEYPQTSPGAKNYFVSITQNAF